MINLIINFFHSYPILTIGLIFSEIMLFVLAINWIKYNQFSDYQGIQKIHENQFVALEAYAY